MKKHLFKMGRITATPGALDRLKASDIDPQDFLKRHVRGDWGDMDKHDKTENDLAIDQPLRVFSAYKISRGKDTWVLWVITEADRSSTTLLLPEEY